MGREQQLLSIKLSGPKRWLVATGDEQLSPSVGREGWPFSEAMLGCEGMGAVAVGRKAEGCQLFGEGELVSVVRRDSMAVVRVSPGLGSQGGAPGAWSIRGVG